MLSGSITDGKEIDAERQRNGDSDGEVAAREPSVGRIEQRGLVRGRLLQVALEVGTAFCTAITGTLASLARGVVELRQTRRLHGGGGAIGGWKLGGLERGDVEIGEALTAQLCAGIRVGSLSFRA